MILYNYCVMFLAVMASSNWKSVPASSFRVSKPSPRRRHVLAAQFPNAHKTERKNDGPSVSTSSQSSTDTEHSLPPCLSTGPESYSLSSEGTCFKSPESEALQLGTCPTVDTSSSLLGGNLKTRSDISATMSSAETVNPDPDSSSTTFLSSSSPALDPVSGVCTTQHDSHASSSSRFSVKQEGGSSSIPSSFRALSSSSFPTSPFRISPISGILSKFLPYTSHRQTSLFSPVFPARSDRSESAFAQSKVVDSLPPSDPLGELDEVIESSSDMELMVEESSLFESREAGCPDEETQEQDSETGVRPMDVEGILLDKHKISVEKCVIEGTDETPREETNLSVELEGGSTSISKQAVTDSKRQRTASSSAAASASDAPTSSDSRNCQTHKRARLSKMDRDRGKRDKESNQTERYQRPRKVTPNAFVAVRVPSRHIREGLATVQSGMVEKEKAVQSALTSLDKLHITLSVIRLEDGDEERAKLALSEAAQKLVADFDLRDHPLNLEFTGLSSFGQNVVFVDLVEKERLSEVAEIVRTVFAEHGFPNTDSREFNPHLTIAKMSRQSRGRGRGRGGGREGGRGGGRGRRGGREGLSGISKELYGEYKDTIFGIQEVTGVELLSMVCPQDKDGYYYCFQRISFEDVSATNCKQLPVDVATAVEQQASGGATVHCGSEELETN